MMTSLVTPLTVASNSSGQPAGKPITSAKKIVVTSIARMN